MIDRIFELPFDDADFDRALVGALAFMDKNPKRRFDDEDVRLLNMFARHAAQALADGLTGQRVAAAAHAQKARRLLECLGTEPLDLLEGGAACKTAGIIAVIKSLPVMVASIREGLRGLAARGPDREDR